MNIRLAERQSFTENVLYNQLFANTEYSFLRKSKARFKDTKGEEFLNFCDDHNLIMLN